MDMSTVISEGRPVLEEMVSSDGWRIWMKRRKEATGVIVSWVAYIYATKHIIDEAGYYDRTNTLFLDTHLCYFEQRFLLFATRRGKESFQGVTTKSEKYQKICPDVKNLC